MVAQTYFGLFLATITRDGAQWFSRFRGECLRDE